MKWLSQAKKLVLWKIFSGSNTKYVVKSAIQIFKKQIWWLIYYQDLKQILMKIYLSELFEKYKIQLT